MKHVFGVVLVSIFLSCNQHNETEGDKSTSKVISNDTISSQRTSVSSKPVASYMVPIGNPKLEYKFGVNIYETPETFKYLMRMQYEGMIVTDTLRIPNFGTLPQVEVRQGPEKLICIIGFLDKEKNFKEYKQLSVADNQLKLTVLKRYGVSTYSTKSSAVD